MPYLFDNKVRFTHILGRGQGSRKWGKAIDFLYSHLTFIDKLRSVVVKKR